MNLMNRHNLSTSSSDPAGVSGTAASSRTVRSTVFFLAKLCTLFLALLFLFGKGIMPQYLYSYNASLLDKMERLTSLTEPKIVLISNSNLAFGMDCSLLEEAFQMPVVNAGVHGGLGNAFQEEIAKVNITEGDLIIVCHTDYDDDDTIVDPVIAWLTVENHPELWRLIRWKDIPDMYFSFPDYAKRVISLWTSRRAMCRITERSTAAWLLMNTGMSASSGRSRNMKKKSFLNCSRFMHRPWRTSVSTA